MQSRYREGVVPASEVLSKYITSTIGCICYSSPLCFAASSVGTVRLDLLPADSSTSGGRAEVDFEIAFLHSIPQPK